MGGVDIRKVAKMTNQEELLYVSASKCAVLKGRSLLY